MSSETLTDRPGNVETYGYVSGVERTFRVDRMAKEGPFSISALGTPKADELSMIYTIRGRFPVGWCPYAIYGVDAPDFIASPNARILRQEQADSANPNLKRYICIARIKPSEPDYEGWFTVDEAHHWAMTEYCWGKPKERYLTKIFYSDITKDGIPIVSRVEDHQEFLGQPFRVVRQYKIESIDFQATSADMFTLESFGLLIDERSYTTLYIWIAVGGVFFLVAAYYLRRRRGVSHP